MKPEAKISSVSALSCPDMCVSDRACLNSRMCQKALCRRPNHSVLRPGSCYHLFPWLDNESIVRHSTITPFLYLISHYFPLHLFCFVLPSLLLFLSVLFFMFYLLPSISFSVLLLISTRISTLSASLFLPLSVSVSISSSLRSNVRETEKEMCGICFTYFSAELVGCLGLR